MAKLTLTDISAGYLSVATYNANNTAIENAIENTLSRDGTAPNTMSVDLDMNSNRVTNVTDGVNNQDAVTVAQLNAASIIGGATMEGLADVNITGPLVDGDLLRHNGTEWVDVPESRFLRADAADTKSTGILRFDDSIALTLGSGDDFSFSWSGSQLDVAGGATGQRIHWRDGTVHRFYEGTDTDYLELATSATYADFSASTNITEIRFTGLDENDTGIVLSDGMKLQFQDLAQTNNIVIGNTGLGGNAAQLEITSAAVDPAVWLRDGIEFRIYDSTDADYLEVSHNGTNVVFASFGTTNYRFEDANLLVMDGNDIRAYGPGNANYVAISHDDTDATILGSGTTNLNIDNSITTIESDANIHARSASDLRVYNADNQDYMRINHNGSSAIFSSFQTANYVFQDADVHIEDGNWLRIYDAANDDFLQIQMDTTTGDVVFEVQGTGSPGSVYFQEHVWIGGKGSSADLNITDGDATDYLTIASDGTDINFTITGGGSLDFADHILREMVLEDVAYQSASETVSGNAVTLTYTEGPGFEVDLEAATGTVTITISGGPPSGDYGVISCKVQQDGTAARTITWAGGTFEWVDGTAHPMNSTLDGYSIYSFETWDGGTTWWGTGADYS